MDDMNPKKYWRHNSWFRRPITIFKLKSKRSDRNYKEGEIDCEVTYDWLNKEYRYSQLNPDYYVSLNGFFHKANKRACGINEIYLFKLTYLKSICQN